jgi:hypothetical protein
MGCLNAVRAFKWNLLPVKAKTGQVDPELVLHGHFIQVHK